MVYSTTLFRPSKPPITSREKYQLTVSISRNQGKVVKTKPNIDVGKIFKSVAEPHTYSAYAKYSRVGTSNVNLLVGPKCKLEAAVNTFKEFFKEQTGKDWDERASGQMPPPKTDDDGNSLPVHEGWFYLEEKTTLLGAFLREPQRTYHERPAVQNETEVPKEQGAEDVKAKCHVEEGTENETGVEDDEDKYEEARD